MSDRPRKKSHRTHRLGAYQVDLSQGEPRRWEDASWDLRRMIEERHPEDAVKIKADFEGGKHRVLATRRAAQKLIELHPDAVRYGTAIHLLADDVEVLSGPFCHELLSAWPHAQLIGGNEDVVETWNMVQERRGS
jgi:hypothetical protein